MLDARAGTDNPVAGNPRFHFPPQVRILRHQLILAAAQFANQLRRFDGDGRMRSQRLSASLVWWR